MTDVPQVLTPLIPQRADPHLTRHVDEAGRARYFFTASVPAYDHIELRAADRWRDLPAAEPRVIWRKPDTGRWSELIWAPELHFRQGAWYVYFAAAPSREIVGGLFQHRMYALRNVSPDPMAGEWEFLGQVDSGIDTFCLDATTFEHGGRLYYLWAQKDVAIPGNSNLYIAPMRTPWQLDGAPVMLSRPEHDWECRGFLVNEGPSVLQRGGKVFISYSASATDENYAMGLLWMDAAADPMDPASWTKSATPVLTTSPTQPVYGPGHNSFALDEDGETVLLVYHARTYTEIVGDPLWNPDRHTFVKRMKWTAEGHPTFGDAGLAT
ncbi:glycoside hydrolase family 43 protein [Mitsuaria sp. GD03876]|uniref:glycoside hydrolase family 43 protein n=1 Tax=Mitsuaria sp. GD03876 TaxID=2975399 RepID=UPI0024483000|nr:glycoside hydrolase family 43 protein [Mitsuaria sp. GD03876]MDH0865842.1 glycoside hydrolase family 43 protein [Mitsuaria sp. GD03876]